jgi:S-adenosylmethionine hydroxide adenosyltransferase-like protein
LLSSFLVPITPVEFHPPRKAIAVSQPLPPVTCITDCTDENASARLSSRLSALFGHTPTLLPLRGSDPERSAALTLLDVLRATDLLGEDGFATVTLLNIAPRDGRWPNGAPFCFFRYGRHLVISTLSARVLSLVRRHLGVTQVQVTDVRTVVEAAAAGWARFDADEVETIVQTQFRSLWYVPLLARWLVEGRPVPATLLDVQIPEGEQDEPPTVAVVDNFGNCKLDRPATELPGFEAPGGTTVEVYSARDGRLHEVGCYQRLAQVPQGAPALVTGSSGFGFAELVVRSGSAAEFFGLREGSPVALGPLSVKIARPGILVA